jgi:transposase
VAMRAEHRRQETMFSYVAPEARVPERHPLRAIRAMVDQALAALDAGFVVPYLHTGRPSVPPEYPLCATLLQILYSVRSECQLVEQIDYNLLFRWFIGLSMDDPVWDHSTFTKNRDRLLEADIARRFFSEVVAQARTAKLLSDEHFSVDGTLIQAWASMKRFRPNDDSGSGPGPGCNGQRDFHGEKRSNDTHASETDPDARLYRKSRGQGAQLCYQSHLLHCCPTWAALSRRGIWGSGGSCFRPRRRSARGLRWNKLSCTRRRTAWMPIAERETNFWKVTSR